LNGAADALSRHDESELVVQSISTSTFTVFDTLRAEAATDPQVTQLCAQLAARTGRDGWSEVDGLLLFRGFFYS
jgi:hypothetical protein